MIALAAVAAAVMWWLTPPGGAGPRRRAVTDRALRGATAPVGGPVSWVEDPRRRGAVCTIGLALLAVATVGLPATPVGLVGGLGLSWWWGRLEPPSAVRRRQRIGVDLPLAADLLAACARIGQPIGASLDVVVEAVGGPLGDQLALVDARIRLGSDPVTEWRRLATHPQLAALSRAVVRCLESGAPVADALDRFAADCRRELRLQAQVRARSVGVKAAGPLAACFLPAFIAIGIVPTVAAAFSGIVLGS